MISAAECLSVYAIRMFLLLYRTSPDTVPYLQKPHWNANLPNLHGSFASSEVK